MISALVLAAGLARRMGTNKLLLPFGERSILAQVVFVLQECLPGEVIVVTGHEHEKVEEAIGRQQNGGLRLVYNPHYAAGEMLSSIQAGLAAVRNDCQAALIALGDQPQIERRIVEQVVAAHEPGTVVIPSFNRHGGHPILIDRACWAEVLALPQGASLREALRAHGDWLRYVRVDSESVLRDVDTPEDYRLITPHVPGFPQL